MDHNANKKPLGSSINSLALCGGYKKEMEKQLERDDISTNSYSCYGQ